MFSVRRWHTTLLRLSYLPSQCATLNESRGAFSSFSLTSELLAATPKLPRPCVRTSEEVFRSAPAPTASDACPFGSLNRTCRPRNYVNINVVATKATNGQNKRPDEVQGLNGHLNGYTKVNGQGVNGHTQSGPIVATPSSNNSSSSTSSVAVQVPRMEINQLTRRHYTFTEGPRGALRQTSTARRQCTSTASTSEEANASQSTTTSASATSDKSTSTTTTTPTSEQRQCYKERCIVGWSLQEFYHVVADVDQYCEFLPWCAASQVHTRTRMSSQSTTTAGSLPSEKDGVASGKSEAAIDETPVEMTATLTIGFAFFKEPYTSKVTLWPGHKIIAVLHDNPPQTSSTTSDRSEGATGLFTSLLRKAAHSATEAARRSILKDLACEWDFVAIPGQPRQVEVHFKVSFEFSNPLYNKMIMSNVVSIMTSSFERRCERLYGPPSTPRRALPLLP